MRELEIKLTGIQNPSETIIKIDDKSIELKKNKFGNLVGKYQTENDAVNIKIYKLLDIGGIFWFITQLFFFVISIFGIFDVHRKERCLIIDFESNIDLKDENKLTLQFNSPQENKKAVDVQTDLITHEITNNYYLDKQAKKTLKILRFAKILLTLVIIAAAIIILMSKL